MAKRGTPKGARSLSELLEERTEWKREFGRSLRAVREASGQSQETYATKVLRISQPYLSQIENGSRTPSEGTLRKLQALTEGARGGDSNEAQAED